MFIVAPSGTVKEEIFFLTLKFFSKLFNVIGIVALLLEVEKANNNACFNPEKKKKLFLFLLLILLTKYIQQKDELIRQ